MGQDRLVIAGASLAGLRAAEAARKAGFSGKIMLIGAERHLPYSRPPLSKEFLGEDPPPDPVFRPLPALRDQLAVDLRLGCRAVGLDARRRVLHCDDGEVPYTALVIATGAQPRTLPGMPAPGVTGMRGVHALRTLDDARSVREALAAGARTIVVGIGAAPCTGWLAGSGVELDERDGGVLCDASLAASVPGIYAAGDVCNWTSGLFGRRLRLQHWTSAAEQGAAAGRNAAAGSAEPYDTVPYFWSDWYGNRIQFAGEPGGDGAAEVVGNAWHDRKLVALYREGDRLTGALTVNRPALIMKLRRLIAGRESWRSAVRFAAAKAVG